MTHQIIENISILNGNHMLMVQAKSESNEDKAEEQYRQATQVMVEIERDLGKYWKQITKDYQKE